MCTVSFRFLVSGKFSHLSAEKTGRDHFKWLIKVSDQICPEKDINSNKPQVSCSAVHNLQRSQTFESTSPLWANGCLQLADFFILLQRKMFSFFLNIKWCKDKFCGHERISFMETWLWAEQKLKEQPASSAYTVWLCSLLNPCVNAHSAGSAHQIPPWPLTFHGAQTFVRSRWYFFRLKIELCPLRTI